MYHPDYAWMFFNWYTSEWWYDKAGSCAEKADKLETVIDTSIVLDHYPRIDKDRLDEPNIANIVSIYIRLYCMCS